mmetsp:Transcript_25180/g.38736  ORF Transcript_25180/g.38736 Transcript_25180/m.38736 type:complete len:132 (-) Transcript_25180:21-416(-)
MPRILNTRKIVMDRRRRPIQRSSRSKNNKMDSSNFLMWPLEKEIRSIHEMSRGSNDSKHPHTMTRSPMSSVHSSRTPSLSSLVSSVTADSNNPIPNWRFSKQEANDQQDWGQFVDVAHADEEIFRYSKFLS